MAATKATPLSQVGSSVRRLQEEADRVVSRVRTKISDFAKSPAKEIEGLVGEARRVRGNVRSQVRTAVRQVEERAEPILNRVEQRVSRVVGPMARYFDLAQRGELQELQRRVATLEKRVQDLTKAAAA